MRLTTGCLNCSPSSSLPGGSDASSDKLTRGSQHVETRFFQRSEPFPLRCGAELDGFMLAYETYGELNAEATNAVLVFHAMTGSHHAAGINQAVPELNGRWTDELHEGWWDAFIGPGRAIDTRKFFVICANYLGGCYGSTGPASLRGTSGRRWGADFPAIRMADIVDSQIHLLDHLGIKTLHAAIGASIGGYLCLSLATQYPGRVKMTIPIASGVETTVLQRLMNFEQIAAIELDSEFRAGRYNAQPRNGLAAARRIAHKTFVSLQHLRARARAEIPSQITPFGWYELNHPVESYLLHQGEKFVTRFDANSYLRILDAWQWFDLLAETGASDFEDLFSRCKFQRFLVFSIDSDACFEPAEQARLVQILEKVGVPVTWISVHSDKGHDAFLLEPHLFAPHIFQTLSQKVVRGQS